MSKKRAIKPFNSPSLEVADIFAEFGDDYKKKYKLSPEQSKVFYDLQHCRDGSFGYRLDKCNHCSETITLNNS